MNIIDQWVLLVCLAVSGVFFVHIRKRLARAERATSLDRDRSEALRSFSAELGQVSSRDEVALAMAEHGAKAVGARLANVALLDSYTDSGLAGISSNHANGSVSASFVLPSDIGEALSTKWARLPLDVPTPLGEAIATRTANFYPSEVELDRRYPHLRIDRIDAGLCCLASIPITDSKGQVVGAAGFAWSVPQDFGPVQRTDITIAAQMCSQALERARAFDLEKENSERARGLALAISGLVSAQIQNDVFSAFRRSLPWLLAHDGMLGVGVQEGVLRVLVPFDVGSNSPDINEEFPGEREDRYSVVVDANRLKTDSETFAVGTGSVLLNPLLIHVASSGEPVFHDGIATDPNMTALQEDGRGGFSSSVALLPLDAGAGFKGVMVLLFANSQQFSDKQRLDLTSFAALSSSALERARRAELEHEIAVTLQASLLPSVPLQIGRVQLAGRYLPGSRYAVVGGDWYDAIRLHDQRILFVVGDVVGHGIQSAAAMGKLSSATRALALVSPEPAELLTHLDAVAAPDEAMRFASMALVLVDLHAGLLTISLAGHPAPLLRHSTGEVFELDAARSVSLGGLPVKRTQQRLYFTGTVELVLYTDGLTERRDQHPSERIDTMVEALGVGAASSHLLSDYLLSQMAADGQSDDIALLCAQMTNGPPDFQRSIPSRANSLAPFRKDFREWTELVVMTQLEREDLILAVGEAATNAIEHGNGGNPTKTVTVMASMRNDQVAITVVDEGGWRPPQSSHGLRGRGLELMRAIVDTVSIETTGAGTAVFLQKTLQQPCRASEDLEPTMTRAP